MEVVGETTAASPSLPPSSSASPPPNCAICLGTCTNKCFSNSCMHQFCFTCLLEWSKIKPECPLCKQTFKSIIHNVKSINEYDEHFIPLPEEQPQADRNEYLYEYLPPAPSRHQFHFRTTFTVDPGGELAIQQMLLSHPLTNVMYMPDYNNPSGTRFHRRRRDTSATSFRRSIYAQNLWVFSPPDVTARYRDCSPYFYSANPAARARLVPWLNRELNALLSENTQQVMHLVDVILEHLIRFHIRSRRFKNILYPYLGSKTEHFVHEFYNFMRSPFDMIGYDRHVIYTDRPHALIDLFDADTDEADNDSDVAVISSTNNVTPVRNMSNPLNRPTLEVIEINSESSRDSDVIIQEPPTPPIVDLVNSDTEDEVEVTSMQTRNPIESGGRRKPLFPLKLRLKNRRSSRDRQSLSRKRRRHVRRSSSSSSSSSTTCSSSTSSTTSSDSSSSDSYERSRYRMKRKHRKVKRDETKTRHKSRRPGKISLSNACNSDSEDDIPLSQLTAKPKGLDGEFRLHDEVWRVVKPKEESGNSSSTSSQRRCRSKREPFDEKPKGLEQFDFGGGDSETKRQDLPCSDARNGFNFNASGSVSGANFSNGSDAGKIYDFKEEPQDNYSKQDADPRPGTSGGRLRSIILKKESDLWYLRPRSFSPDSSD